MIRVLRKSVANWLVEASKSLVPNLSWTDKAEKLAWCIRFRSVSKRSDVSQSQIYIPFSLLRACGLANCSSSASEYHMWANSLSQFHADPYVRNISVIGESFTLDIDHQHLAQCVLGDILACGANYGRDSDLYWLKPSPDGRNVIQNCSNQNVIVEFSSPNIAKPFHAGHLRSTILGQFVANICQLFGQNVIRLNYLGDWGTQFGLLGVGFEKYGNINTLKSNPIQHLFEVYVKINKDADKDDAIHAAGMEYFSRMEQGDKNALSFWTLCRQLSIDEYSSMYKRLGVCFTHIHGESMYHNMAKQLVQNLQTRGGILQNDSKTGVTFIDLSEPGDKTPFYGNLVKSDGSTLYLTRDVAAAIDRQQTFHADKLYYVVENGQHQHFKQLLRTLKRMDVDWAQDYDLEDLHIKFGRVEGMSTRRGEVVFLRDILDEAKSHMLDTIKLKKTTKITSSDVDSVAEALGVSAILVQDMKEYRLRNYEFSWERLTNFNGDTGVFLQYTHARLNSLICGVCDKLGCVEPDYALLTEDSAKRLVQHLARFDEVLLRSYADFEPCHLVHYLFNVGRLVNVAHDELFVMGQPEQLAKTRLQLFQAAKTVVANGMSVLGLTPLDRM